ncbi:MAG: hypothetical protein AAFY41_15745, partial [Bacteroidota bacterium]
MPDITGRIYESFTEFILQLLGFQDESCNTADDRYLYEKSTEATCYKSKTICPFSQECREYSRKHDLPYGPWYDPDFLIFRSNKPHAAIHVTHWSSPGNSPFKFWRTLEDHFQYKTLFGAKFLSVNFIFVALHESSEPQRVLTLEKLELHGWKPAIGSLYASALDGTILFPRFFSPLEKLACKLPSPPKNPMKKRVFYRTHWENLYRNDIQVKEDCDKVSEMLASILCSSPSPYYSHKVITHLQKTCFEGRQRTVASKSTETRYRKGIQYSYLLREVSSLFWNEDIDSELLLWEILSIKPRFSDSKIQSIIKNHTDANPEKIKEFISVLMSLPIQIKKFEPYFLLRRDGVGHLKWAEDFGKFIESLKKLEKRELDDFKVNVTNLFKSYQNSYGLS